VSGNFSSHDPDRWITVSTLGNGTADQTHDAQSPYLTTAQAAAYLRYRGPSAIRNHVAAGRLRPYGRRGRTMLFRPEDLDAMIRGHGAPMASDGVHDEQEVRPLSGDRSHVRRQKKDPAPRRRPTNRTDEEVDRTVTATVEEASRLREQWREEIRSADQVAREAPRLRDYVQSWLRSKASGLKPSTARTYADVLGGQVLPGLGDFFIDKLTHAEVREWHARMAAAHKAATVNGAVVMLRMVLADAVVEYRLPHNPAARVKKLPVRAFTDEEPNLLTGDELAGVLVVFRDHIPEHYPLALTLAFTGMRYGEATALRWDDIEEAEGLIRVRRAQWEGNVSTTKTEVKRSVPLAPLLTSVLREHRAGMLATQHPGLASGWVFTDAEGGLLPKCVLRFPLRRALKLAGVRKRVTTHGLRRTFNNLSRQLNGEIVTRSMTGHVTEAMTEHYSHVGREEKLAAMGRIAQLVALAEPPSGGSSGGSTSPTSSAVT
jgi:integrase